MSQEEYNNALEYFFRDSCEWVERVGKTEALDVVNHGSLVKTFDDAGIFNENNAYEVA
jgi:hypothetical protein